MAAPRLVLINLPSPPGKNISRDVAGGFGRFHSNSDRETPGHDVGVHFNPPAIEAHGAALAEFLGIDVAIVDGQGENLSTADLARRISSLRPDGVLLKPCLPSYTSDLEIISSLKERVPETSLIAWGALSSSMPGRLLSESRIDSISILSLPATISSLFKNKLSSDIPQIIGGKAGERGSCRTAIVDFDSLPFPAYHLLDMGLYRIKSQNRFAVYGSVGCSFSCFYCPYPIGFGSPWMGRNPKRVFEEIRRLGDEHGVEQIGFRDQTWNMDLKRSMRLCKLIGGWRDSLEWSVAVRADRLDRDLARSMKEAGCRRVDLGLETGDPNLFNSVGKRASTLRAVERGFRNAKRAGILTTANIMIGLPGDGWGSVDITKRVLKRLSPENVLASIATPYPGTLFYKQAVENGWLVDDRLDHLDGITPVLSYPEFSCSEIAEATEKLKSWRRSEKRLNRVLGLFGNRSEVSPGEF